ncbi:MAG TPA: alpha/beta fold hydrolase [Terriglobales bacterium]
MPTVKVNGVELFYKETGRGPETIVFSHGLLMDHTMFEAQRAAFDEQYRVIAYDHRGQGLSARSKASEGGWGEGMDNLATDAAGLIQALDAAPCHFAGLSMGGFVGLRLAIRRPALLRSLTAMNTGADREPWPNRVRYGFLAHLVRVMGTAPFTSVAVKALFGESTRHDPGRRAMLDEWTAKLRRRPRHAADALVAVIEREGMTADQLRSINCPTLVIAGEDDTSRPPADSERLAAFIPGAKLVRIPNCGHSSALEAPDAVVNAMRMLLRVPTEARVPIARA